MILSQEGLPQGDPMGPLLFSLTLAGVLNRCSSEFTVGYLNDITLGDSVSKLVDQVKDFEKESSMIGLSLNHAKSEVMGLSHVGALEWGRSNLDFKQCIVGQESLLGSPLGDKGVGTVLDTQVAVLWRFDSHLTGLSTHESF